MQTLFLSTSNISPNGKHLIISYHNKQEDIYLNVKIEKYDKKVDLPVKQVTKVYSIESLNFYNTSDLQLEDVPEEFSLTTLPVSVIHRITNSVKSHLFEKLGRDFNFAI